MSARQLVERNRGRRAVGVAARGQSRGVPVPASRPPQRRAPARVLLPNLGSSVAPDAPGGPWGRMAQTAVRYLYLVFP